MELLNRQVYISSDKKMSIDNRKQCKYGCGKEITYIGKNENIAGSTGYYEIGSGTDIVTRIEHTYDRCKKLRAEQDELQTRLS